KLVNDGQLTVTGDGNDATYTAVEPASEETSEQAVVSEGGQANNETAGQGENQPPVETETGKKNDTSVTKITNSRNNDKFSFNGLDGLGKGPLCRELIKKVVADNPGITVKKL